MHHRQFDALFSRDAGESIRTGRRFSAEGVTEIAASQAVADDAASTTPVAHDTSILSARLVTGVRRTAQGGSSTDAFSCVLRLEDGTLSSARVTIQFEGESEASELTLREL